MSCGCLVITSDLGALKETMNGLNEYVDINIYNFDINNLEKNVYVQGNRWYYYNPSTKGLMSICAIYGYIYKHSIEVKINDNNIDVEIKDFKDLQIII